MQNDRINASMDINGWYLPLPLTTAAQRHLVGLVSSIALRLLVALLISWMIFMAFFVSGAISR